MTSPYVTFPRPTVPPQRQSAWPVLRVMLSVAAVLGGAAGAVIAGFIAIVTWSGCFISCTGENHPAGAALAVLSIVLLAGGPATVAALYRSRIWLAVAGLAAFASTVLFVVGAAGG